MQAFKHLLLFSLLFLTRPVGLDPIQFHPFTKFINLIQSNSTEIHSIHTCICENSAIQLKTEV